MPSRIAVNLPSDSEERGWTECKMSAYCDDRASAPHGHDTCMKAPGTHLWEGEKRRERGGGCQTQIKARQVEVFYRGVALNRVSQKHLLAHSYSQTVSCKAPNTCTRNRTLSPNRNATRALPSAHGLAKSRWDCTETWFCDLRQATVG